MTAAPGNVTAGGRSVPIDTSGKSANLDFLRAYAVMSVYFGHLLFNFHIYKVLGCVRTFHIANTGVLIFFVHTCLVLMRSLERIRAPGWRLFAVFYIRRIFRIYPLSTFAVVFFFAAHIPATPLGDYAWLGWGTLVSNVALTQNLSGSISVPGVLWTLPYEVQMYAVLPVIFLLIQRFHSRWVPVVLWFGAVGMLMLHLKVRVVPYTAPSFLAGIIGYRLWRGRRMRLPFWGWPLAIVSCVALRVFAEMSSLDTAIELAPWLGCLLLGLAVAQFEEADSGWVRSAAAKIAQYSYGIYLSHFAVFWVAFVLLKGESFWFQASVCAVLSLILPPALYHGIEKPMIDWGVRIARAAGTQPAPALEPRSQPAAVAAGT